VSQLTVVEKRALLRFYDQFGHDKGHESAALIRLGGDKYVKALSGLMRKGLMTYGPDRIAFNESTEELWFKLTGDGLNEAERILNAKTLEGFILNHQKVFWSAVAALLFGAVGGIGKFAVDRWLTTLFP